jgi:cytochrome c peroxidase
MRLSSVLVLCVVAASACTQEDAAFPSEEELGQLSGLHNVRTPPRETGNKFADSATAAALGKRLFADPGFSSCGAIACASCHPAPTYTVPLAFPPGCNGAVMRSPPSLLNAAFSNWFYWDGRKDALWSHPTFPLLNEIELAATPQSVRAHMQDTYAADYAAVFGRAPSAETDDNRIVVNFGKAVSAHLRTLIRVRAPFDDNLDRFIAAARAGTAEKDPMYLQMKTFIRTGRCIICHKGPMLSDGAFHNLGLKNSAGDHGHLGGIAMLMADPYNGASQYSDDPISGKAKLATLTALPPDDVDGAFKTPSLRNVALTAPYMHNSEYKTLNEVIDFYDRGGDPEGTFSGKRAVTMIKLGLSMAEKQALLDLLASLTGSEEP